MNLSVVWFLCIGLVPCLLLGESDRSANNEALKRSLLFLYDRKWENPEDVFIATVRKERLEELREFSLQEDLNSIPVSIIEDISQPVGEDRGTRKVFVFEKGIFEPMDYKTWPELLLYVGFQGEGKGALSVFLNTINNPYNGVVFLFEDDKLISVMQWPPTVCDIPGKHEVVESSEK